MQLRVADDKKRAQYKFKENEGLQFAFDIEQDKPEEVVQQMIEQQHIPDNDTSTITKLIRDKVEAFKRDREYRHAEIKRQKEEEERKAEEQAVKEEIKARREREKAAAAEKDKVGDPLSPPTTLPQMSNQPQPPSEVISPASSPCQNTETSGSTVNQNITPAQVVAAAKKSKRKIVMEILKVYNDGATQPLVSCKLDTANKSVVFQFAPEADKPHVIAEKLVDQDCISHQHVAPVVEQLDRVIQAVKTESNRGIGLKITSYVDSTTGSVDTIVRQMSQEIVHPNSHVSVCLSNLAICIQISLCARVLLNLLSKIIIFSLLSFCYNAFHSFYMFQSPTQVHPPSSISPTEESVSANTDASVVANTITNNQPALQASAKPASRFTVTPSNITSTSSTLPLPPSSEYVDVEHRVRLLLSFLFVLFKKTFFICYALNFQKLSAAPALHYSPATMSNDSKTNLQSTPSGSQLTKNRFQVQAVPNPPPASVTPAASSTQIAQHPPPPQTPIDRKSSSSNLMVSSASAAKLPISALQNNAPGAAEFTLEQLDSELRKVSGVQPDVVTVSNPHVVHNITPVLSTTSITSVPVTISQTTVANSLPATQQPVPPSVASAEVMDLVDLNEKLSLLTNKQLPHEYTENNQQIPPSRNSNVVSRAGSVVPDECNSVAGHHHLCNCSTVCLNDHCVSQVASCFVVLSSFLRNHSAITVFFLFNPMLDHSLVNSYVMWFKNIYNEVIKYFLD